MCQSRKFHADQCVFWPKMEYWYEENYAHADLIGKRLARITAQCVTNSIRLHDNISNYCHSNEASRILRNKCLVNITSEWRFWYGGWFGGTVGMYCFQLYATLWFNVNMPNGMRAEGNAERWTGLYQWNGITHTNKSILFSIVIRGDWN